LYITRLPIVGKAVIAPHLNVIDECTSLLGINPRDTNSVDLNLNELNIIDGIPAEWGDDVIDRYAPRAYMLDILGCIVLPTVPKLKVPVMYFSLLREISDVDTFAWGATMLAHVHSALIKAKNGETRNFSAAALVLHV
jgi:hypothetical protein